MLKKTITYTDFNDVERTEDHYFNLSRAELLDLEFKRRGGLKAMIERVVQEQDTVEIYNIFTDIIKMSYGRKSDDGKRFEKSEALTRAFLESDAYSELMLSLIGVDGEAALFVEGITPKTPQDHKTSDRK